MKRNFLIIAGVIVLAIILILSARIISPEDTWLCVKGEWTKHGNPSSAKPLVGCGQEVASTAVNFNETGHLVKDNPGLKPGVWFLVYEKPGVPALTTELSFDSGSKCKLNGTEGICPDVLLPGSALTKIEGVEKDGIVRVVSAVSGNNN
jgi:hypothetical protein